MHHVYIYAEFLKKQINAANCHNNGRENQNAAGEWFGTESGRQIIIYIEKGRLLENQYNRLYGPYHDRYGASHSIYYEWHYYGLYGRLYDILHNFVRVLQDIIHLFDHILYQLVA